MRKRTKKNVCVLSAAAVSLFCTTTVFAGSWKSNQTGWWWQNDDGSYPMNTWQWIDGDNDGIAESYYFNEDGYCLLNTMTPDGYTVNASGAWIINDIVQTRPAAASQPSLPKEVAKSTEYNGHVYYRIDQGMTWYEAQDFCERLGGHLVVISSEEEQKVIEELIKDGTQKQYWLGGYSDDGWQWITGESWGYSNWAYGEPNSYRNNESFAQIYRLKNPKRTSSFGEWNDISEDNYISDETDFFSTEYIGIICEIE